MQETDYYETLHNIIQSDKVAKIQWSYEEAWLHDILGTELDFATDSVRTTDFMGFLPVIGL